VLISRLLFQNLIWGLVDFLLNKNNHNGPYLLSLESKGNGESPSGVSIRIQTD